LEYFPEYLRLFYIFNIVVNDGEEGIISAGMAVAKEIVFEFDNRVRRGRKIQMSESQT